ncbi:hypothetical protein LBMAG42_32590 [Deltaproteobacteria bacterium]|nr:hypothetical protein LBMAG42_32590 [Deltaproteobacteria bacterium]
MVLNLAEGEARGGLREPGAQDLGTRVCLARAGAVTGTEASGGGAGLAAARRRTCPRETGPPRE